MPLILSGNVAAATASTTYDVTNSCRFDQATNGQLSKTFGSAGDLDKWTFSVWLKRADVGQSEFRFIYIGRTGGTNVGEMYFHTDDTLKWLSYTSGYTVELVTNRVFRDTSAWYHFVFVYDSAQGVAANRCKIYVNGIQETSFSTETYPDQNEDSEVNKAALHGNYHVGDDDKHFAGYMAEMAFFDGQAIAIGDLGEFDSDSPTIWKPKNLTGLTFGSNGYWLDFENSAALGNDVSGNDNDWTAGSLAATDQATDTPTNNFCTWNPLDNYFAGGTFAEGNCKITTGSSPQTWNTGTFGLSAGKWYFEAKITQFPTSNNSFIGVSAVPSDAAANYLGEDAFGWGILGQTGNVYNSASSSSYANALSINDIVGWYLDLDNSKLYLAINGTVQNSGTGVSITAVASTPNGVYFPAIGDYNNESSAIWECNFGGCSAFTVSSAVADDDGSGAFEYDPTAGTFDSASKKFYAINSKNLAEYG